MHYILIDGTNIAWQVYHSAKVSMPNFDEIPPENAKEVIYGFLNVLAPVVNPTKKDSVGSKIKDDVRILVALDHGKSWRFGVDPDYKNGHSAPAADSYAAQKSRFGTQMAKLPGQLAKFGIDTLKLDGLEADDIIALVATDVLQNPSNKVTVISKDKDLLALVNPNCSYYNQALKELVTPTNFEVFTAKAFKISKGITPQELPTFRGLSGDTSDNISGVPGCASGYANMIVQALRPSKVLTGFTQNPDEICAALTTTAPTMSKPLQGLITPKNLIEFKKAFLLASPLASPEPLKASLKTDFSARPVLKKPTQADLKTALEELNFHHFVSQLPKWGAGFAQPSPSQELPLL